MSRREDIEKIIFPYEGEYICKENIPLIVDSLVEYFQRETEQLVKTLNTSIDCMQTIYDGRLNCGDPDSECPLQDASCNDEWSLLSRLNQAKEAIKKVVS